CRERGGSLDTDEASCTMIAWTSGSLLCFFFQAEDGIRDPYGDWSSDVCSSDLTPVAVRDLLLTIGRYLGRPELIHFGARNSEGRSEERRVGKECRSRGSSFH